MGGSKFKMITMVVVVVMMMAIVGRHVYCACPSVWLGN